jgi:hypothetical protein
MSAYEGGMSDVAAVDWVRLLYGKDTTAGSVHTRCNESMLVIAIIRNAGPCFCNFDLRRCMFLRLIWTSHISFYTLYRYSFYPHVTFFHEVSVFCQGCTDSIVFPFRGCPDPYCAKSQDQFDLPLLLTALRMSVLVVTGDLREVVIHLPVDKINVDMTTRPVSLHHSHIVFWQSQSRIDPLMGLECRNFWTTLVKSTGNRELSFTHSLSPSL